MEKRREREREIQAQMLGCSVLSRDSGSGRGYSLLPLREALWNPSPIPQQANETFCSMAVMVPGYF